MSYHYTKLENPIGERKKDALRVNFDRKLELEFHGVKVTSDSGLLTFRELDEAFGFTVMINSKLTDKVCAKAGIGRKVRHKKHIFVQIFKKLSRNQKFLIVQGNFGEFIDVVRINYVF